MKRPRFGAHGWRTKIAILALLPATGIIAFQNFGALSSVLGQQRQQTNAPLSLSAGPSKPVPGNQLAGSQAPIVAANYDSSLLTTRGQNQYTPSAFGQQQPAQNVPRPDFDNRYQNRRTPADANLSRAGAPSAAQGNANPFFNQSAPSVAPQNQGSFYPAQNQFQQGPHFPQTAPQSDLFGGVYRSPHNPKVQELVGRLRGAAYQDANATRSVKEELKEALAEEFDQKHAKHREQIESLEQKLAEAKALHSKREEKKQEIVERRMAELLGQTDDLSWDLSDNRSNSPNFPAPAFAPHQNSLAPSNFSVPTTADRANTPPPARPSTALVPGQSSIPPSQPKRSNLNGADPLGGLVPSQDNTLHVRVETDECMIRYQDQDDGHSVVKTMVIQPPDLARQLKKLHQTHPTLGLVSLFADADLDWNTISETMKSIREAGFREVSLQTSSNHPLAPRQYYSLRPVDSDGNLPATDPEAASDTLQPNPPALPPTDSDETEEHDNQASALPGSTQPVPTADVSASTALEETSSPEKAAPLRNQ